MLFEQHVHYSQLSVGTECVIQSVRLGESSVFLLDQWISRDLHTHLDCVFAGDSLSHGGRQSLQYD
jgi:hypothetical protein